MTTTFFTGLLDQNYVRVTAAVPGHNYPQPDIVGMHPTAIKNLYYGYLVNVWVDQPDGKPLKLEKIKSVSIFGLCTISPVIKAAVQSSGITHQQTDHIVLPPGQPEAYGMLIKWFNNATMKGDYRHVEAEYDSPLFKYYHVLEVAQKLRIDPVLQNLAPRYSKMITYKTHASWNVNPDDVRRVYTDLADDHPLRLAIVKGVAAAWYHNDLGRGKRKRIEQITWEVPKLWEDLNLLWRGFEKDGI